MKIGKVMVVFICFTSVFLIILWDSNKVYSHKQKINIPEKYAHNHAPEDIWTSPDTLTKGKEVYTTYCLPCHGVNGDGRGPIGQALNPKPSDFSDNKMVSSMPGNHWFWRISEGGMVEPFKSQGSTMPAWKSILSEKDIWAVIAYEHTFSGHQGPHTVKAHRELEAGEKPEHNQGH